MNATNFLTAQTLENAAKKMMTFAIMAGLTKEQAQQMLTDSLKNGDFENMVKEAIGKM